MQGKYSNIVNQVLSAPGNDLDSQYRLDPKDLVVIRSDPLLQMEEIARITERKTLRESLIILDYLEFFDRLRLPKEIFPDKDRSLLQLYKNYPVSLQPAPPALPRDIMREIQTRDFWYTKVITQRSEEYKNFVSKVIEKLLEQLPTAAKAPNSSPLKEDLTFGSMALRMAEHALDFCSDPYYLTPARSQLVGVLPLGRVKFFGCAGTPQFTSLRGKEHVSFDKELLPLLNSDYHIGLLSETAASSEVLPRLVEKFKDDQTIFIAPSPSRLTAWVHELQRTRPPKSRRNWIVIADVDILKTIELDKFLRLPFSNVRGHPAGFLYPLGDNKWRSAMALAVAETLVSQGAPPAQVWQEVSFDLESVGIKPLSGEELVQELLLDMNRPQAIQWRQEAGRLDVTEISNRGPGLTV